MLDKLTIVLLGSLLLCLGMLFLNLYELEKIENQIQGYGKSRTINAEQKLENMLQDMEAEGGRGAIKGGTQKSSRDKKQVR